MVARQIARRGVRDPRVLQAMREVAARRIRRAGFRGIRLRGQPPPDRRTVDDLAAIYRRADDRGRRGRSGDRVLEIGTGSGYAAAVLGRIADEVYTIERHASLVEAAVRRFARLGYRNIKVRRGDGSLGWPDATLAIVARRPRSTTSGLHR